MPRALTLLSLLAALLLPGCGPKELPYTDNSKDPESYARDVKQQVFNLIRVAKTSREPADELHVIVLKLEGQESNHDPVGSYKPIYAEILNKTKPLYEECKNASGGKAQNLSTRLDEIKKAAEKLPGEVQAEQRPPK